MVSVKITGDSTIDLSNELKEKYNISTVPLYIVREATSDKDGVTITPDDIYEYVDKTKKLPKTSAPSVSDYVEFFTEQKKQADEIIHFNISSEMSSAHQNARIAAEEVGGVYVIDSRNLSTGTGSLTICAAKMASDQKPANDIVNEITSIIDKVETSFIINRLDYLYKGGRCSGVAALGANMLKLRPVILVENGKMGVGKKFRGKYVDCVVDYIKSKLEGRDDIRDDFIFITHTKCTDEVVKAAYTAVKKYGKFKTIYETTAGCTITTHCGENTLGILFIRK